MEQTENKEIKKIRQSSISGSFAKDSPENKKKEQLQKGQKRAIEHHRNNSKYGAFTSDEERAIYDLSLKQLEEKVQQNKLVGEFPHPAPPYNPIAHYKNQLTKEMVDAYLYPIILETLQVSGGMQFYKALKNMVQAMCPFQNIRLMYNDGYTVNVTPSFVWRNRTRINDRDTYFYQDLYLIDTGILDETIGKNICIKFVLVVDVETGENNTKFEVISEMFNILNKGEDPKLRGYSVQANIHPYAQRVRVK